MVPNHQPDIHVYNATDEILKRLIFCTGPMRFWLLWSHGTKPSGFAPSIGLAQAAQVHGIQEFYGSNPEPPMQLVKPQLFWGFLSHRATPSSHL